MNRSRHQLLAGAAFSRQQNGRIGRRHFGNELQHIAHCLTFADHVVLDTEVGDQPLIFADEPFDMSRVFQSYGGDGGDCRHELQVVLVENSVWLLCVEINNTQRALQHDERHAQD